MTIEIALLISIISVLFGVYQGITNIKRNNKCDDKSEATQLTTVIVKLENIGDGVSEIKGDLKSVKDDVKEFREWKATATQQIKALEKNVFSKEE